MNSDNVYIVGDRFKNFTCNEGVYTLSQFMSLVQENPKSLESKNIHIGQGLSINSAKMVKHYLEHYKLPLEALKADDSIDKKYVHKHKEQNVLLGTPEKISDTEFKASLLLDERCAEISDHMTGQHIQGMVLTEAARQMFIGVTEAFFIPEEMIGDIVYIFNKMNIEYMAFVFPLPIEIRYKILTQSSKRPGSIKSTVKIEFYQNEVLTCDSEIDFSTYEKDFIHKLEGSKAEECVKLATDLVAPSAAMKNKNSVERLHA